MRQQAGGSLAGFILDLRNDAGGLLDAAVEVSDDFLDKGAVVTTRGRDSDENRVYEAPPNGDLIRGIPMVVLINGASASASEIVAGALQDNHRATVMGTHSFGKGSVQSIIPLEGHGALRLTTSLYYTPSGRSIQGHGITPDRVIDVPKDQQVANAVITYEKDLFGSIKTPGAIGAAPRPATRAAAKPATAERDRPPDEPENHRHRAGRPAQRRPRILRRLAAPPPDDGGSAGGGDQRRQELAQHRRPFGVLGAARGMAEIAVELEIARLDPGLGQRLA